eukprot:2077761-Rhodomonas_salina.1
MGSQRRWQHSSLGMLVLLMSSVAQDSYDSHLDRAETLVGKGKVREALAELDAASRISPKRPEALVVSDHLPSLQAYTVCCQRWQALAARPRECDEGVVAGKGKLADGAASEC